jgi:single-strand DNA-binding protein
MLGVRQPIGRRGQGVIKVAVGETILTVSGRIVTELERRDLGERGEMVGFLVISTERKFDKASGDWVDGRKFSIWVACFRRLARNVAMTMHKGDDVIVCGRLHTREYEDGGKLRYATELAAYAVGPNLTRAIADVRRIRAGDGLEAEAPAAA